MARIKIGNVRTPVDYLKQIFAPAGYGWGEGKPAAQFNEINVNRTAVFVASGEDMPTNDSVWQCEFYATSSDGNGNYGHMVATCQSGVAQGCCCIRLKENGVYGEWEWFNPPMVFGKEYRTTERRNGMPVYRKLVTYKPDSTISGSFVVPHGIDNFDALVDAFATINATIPLPLAENNYTTALKTVESSGIQVSNNNPYFDQNYIWYFYLSYTKKV